MGVWNLSLRNDGRAAGGGPRILIALRCGLTWEAETGGRGGGGGWKVEGGRRKEEGKGYGILRAG